MRTISLKSIGLSAAVIIGAIVVGMWGGTMFGNYKAEAKRSEQGRQAQMYLNETIVGIEVGAMLPDFGVGASTGGDAMSVHELLPHGGLLVYVSADCNGCVPTLKAIEKARASGGFNDVSVVVVADGDASEIAKTAAQSDIHMPIYSDVGGTLAQHKVAIMPTTFVLNRGGVVVDLVAGTQTASDFKRVLDKYRLSSR